ncbi:MAG: hypothetical protein J2P37_23845 [Ktedonobacteraceae bacterium]|nr:hypothetical protein [Ktedonobacteraceae bacterium]MBO0791877.1 hypothetical protein [Ktedonobacteraceae bacterium]
MAHGQLMGIRRQTSSPADPTKSRCSDSLMTFQHVWASTSNAWKPVGKPRYLLTQPNPGAAARFSGDP